MISESTIERIKAAAQIADFCTDVKKAYGQNRLYCECPACHYCDDKKKQGLQIDQKKNVAKCFKCGKSYSGAINFLMETTGASYPDALTAAARQYGIFIEETAGSTSSPTAGKSKGRGLSAKQSKATPSAPEPKPVPEKFPIEPQKIANQISQKLKDKEAKKLKEKFEKAGARASENKPVQDPETRNPQPDAVSAKQSNGATRNASFCDTQLTESGLTYDDCRIETKDEKGTTRYISPFCQGTRDQFGNYLEQKGDDMLIKYYDLDGAPVMYKPERTTNMRPLIRVRWQNPAAHPDKDGNPIKYQSPAGSGSHVYIPEVLRRMYRHARKIKRLYIQEGEKKAEKSCKHGIMSVGIMGINNLATDGRLPDEIQLIVQRCEVEEVIFVLDSDWRNLSEKLETGKSVDTRPRQFFAAVRSFKEYLRTLANLGCSVEIYFSYIKFNDAKAKGIDDLFMAFPDLTSPEREAVEGEGVNACKLAADFDFAVNEKSGSGKFVQVNKITMLPDDKIADFWLLNDAEKFADYHKSRLKDLKEFKIKGYLRRFNERGTLEMAQQLFKEEQFWDEQEKTDKDGKVTSKTLVFDYVNAMNFAQRRGFWRLEMKSGERLLIRVEQRTIKTIDHTDVKDFFKDFCREIKRLDVLNMLMRGGPQYLGPEKLSNLDIYRPNIERATAEKQNIYFRKTIWEITAERVKEINYGQFTEYVWSEKIIDHEVKLFEPFVQVTVMTDELRAQLPNPELYANIENGEFFLDYSEQSKECHFLQFLMNASNFNHRKKELTIEDQFLHARNLLNKLTAFGYLLHDYKDETESKAVIAVDGKISEVGVSNGGSGKSIGGEAIGQIVPQVIIDGKNKKLDDDNFRYNDVTEKTKSLFFDDVRPNFEFESVFSIITNGMTVNQKSGRRFSLSKQDTPKLYISTNHMLNGVGSSFTRRQAYIVFSDFYNATHQPIHDFGVPFFSGWDANQWNLFYNLKATCVLLYLKSKQQGWSGAKGLGIVPPPMEDVERRKLRQLMGESFLTWAEAYFHWDEERHTGNLNQRHSRKELFDDYLNENPLERKYCNAPRFKEKVLAYCRYAGLDFNPKQRNSDGLDLMQYYPKLVEQRPDKTLKTILLRDDVPPFVGRDDKTGGKEYFTLANKDFNETFQ